MLMEHQETSSAKYNMIDIKRWADKFDEKSITREQPTVYHKWIHKQSESNLLSSKVRFDRIDAAMIMITKLKPKNL